jgi:hypothetical protein
VDNVKFDSEIFAIVDQALEECLEVFSVFGSGRKRDLLEIGRVFSNPLGELQRVDRTEPHGV